MKQPVVLCVCLMTVVSSVQGEGFEWTGLQCNTDNQHLLQENITNINTCNDLCQSFYGNFGNIGNCEMKNGYDECKCLFWSPFELICRSNLILFRPSTGKVSILKNNGNVFFPTYSSTNGIGGYDMMSAADQGFAFDFDHSGKLNYIVVYRPGTGTIWILKKKNGNFVPVFAQGDPGNGIGGYDLRSRYDRSFAFDYDHSGKQDHIVLYRPGTGTMWILKHTHDSSGIEVFTPETCDSRGTENFTPVYAQGDPGNGIGGYDLRSPNDRSFAFDYDHSGKQDHIVLYRPGTGTMWILKHTHDSSGIEVFTPVYAQGDPGNGIGGYDLKSPFDRSFAFDYDHSGKQDHIVLYRPGTGTMWILKHTRDSHGSENFSPVYAQGDPGNGIGGYDLKSPYDRSFAFDYDHSGKMDHIVLYRPGTGIIWVLKNRNGQFSTVYAQGYPGKGIGGYDLLSIADDAFAFDYNGDGKEDHIVLTRPGTGTIWILKNEKGQFSPVFAQGDPGNGIGGYDLRSPFDRSFAFDYDHSGKQDHIVLYRPGTGTMWILKHTHNSSGTEVFTPVYAQGDPGNGIGGYDLRSSYDRSFAFDYDHSGKQDHIVLYRPGTGTMWILKHVHNSGGTEAFTPVYAQGDPGNGIGGYDLRSPYDRSFAFDYDHSGKQDHIVLYRPGTGTMWILKHTRDSRGSESFTPVYAQGDPGNGIGGYDLKSPYDRSFAFDYDHSGKMDHIVLYRPGTGTIWILKNQNGQFSAIYAQGDPGKGIGGYDLLSTADYAFAFDYNRNGRKNHIVLTRPGTGTIRILENENGQFSSVFAQGDRGNGIGGYDLKSNLDTMFGFDDC